MKPDICIYHGPGCMDGLVAAWAIWKRWPDIQFIPAMYGQAPPPTVGKHILIVDFSYKYQALLGMAEDAKSITILDHHKTAQDDLAMFVYDDSATPLMALDTLALCDEHVQALFDIDKSGARLAWEYAFPEMSAPLLVQHVEDRDLWRFRLPFTKAVQAYLASVPDLDFQTLDLIASQLEEPDSRRFIQSGGELLLRAYQKQVADLIAATRRTAVIAGYEVPVANMPPSMASDAGNIMGEGQPFAATYFDTADGKRAFSLRSAQDGLDVSEIAKRFGGGGHQHAAGFAIDLDRFTWESV